MGVLGINLYCKEGKLISAVGLAMVLLGIITPVVPWWVFVFGLVI
jgi:hypothetical protein